MTIRAALTHNDARIATTIAAAERWCAERQVRLTAQRRRVLEIVAAQPAAVGAYEILQQMTENGRLPAPISIYRALQFWVQQGLVHRLASRNAFVACSAPAAPHAAQFLICQRCDGITEFQEPTVRAAIDARARALGFAISACTIEAIGTCAGCRDRAGDAA
jgi:Fur family zinc uptake transcriptional regulator